MTREHAEASADTAQATQVSSRPRTASPAERVLALQAAGGNAATGRLLHVQREPAAAPELDSRAMAVTLQPTLQKERDEAFAAYQQANNRIGDLQSTEDTVGLTEKDKAEKVNLEAARAASLTRLSAAEKDLQLLNEPGASNQALNDLMARRQTNVSVGNSVEGGASGWRLDQSGLSSSEKIVLSEVNNGKSTSTTIGSTTTIDATGWSKKDSTSAATVAGDTTTTSGTATTRKVDVSGGDVSYAKADTVSSSTTEAGGSSTSVTNSSKLGTGGYTSGTETTNTQGSTVVTTKDSRSITRGDGKLGASTTSSTRTGTQDAEGNLTRGTETSRSAGGGVISGPDGTGAYASAGADRTQTHAKGVKTGQSVGMDGKYVVNVTQVPDSNPPRYQVSLTVNLGVKVGASGNVEKEVTPNAETGKETFARGTKGTYGISGSGSAGVTGTFVHVFSAEEASRYLGSLSANGSGGSQKELQVLELAGAGKLAAAKAMLSGLQATAMSADAAAAMSEGDSAELSLEAKGDAKATGGASGGGFGASASFGLSGGETLKRSVARKDGKIVITVSVLTSHGYTVGGTGSAGAASGGLSHSDTDTAGQTVTFTLDPNDPAYRQNFAAIAAAGTVPSLKALVASRPELVGSRTETAGNSSSNTTTAGVGPVSLELTDTHAYTESTTTDARGHTTTNYTGSTGGGAGISVAGGPKISANETDTVAATVDENGKATGDVSTSTSQTNVGSSWSKFWTNLSDHPLDTVKGLVTGSGKNMQEDTEVAGMKLSDGDFQTIAAVAQDPVAWERPIASPRLLPDWRATRRAVIAANGDRKAIAHALTGYASTDDGAAKAISLIVRPSGSASGGTRYDWPGDLSAEKSTYTTLVDGDPLAPARSLEAGGKYPEALESANTTVSKLDALAATLQSKRDKFTDSAAYVEMLTRIGDRRADAAHELATIRLRQTPSGAKVSLPAPNVTTVPTAEQSAAIDAAAAGETFAGYQSTLNAFLDQQTKSFGLVQAELAKKDAIFSSPDAVLIAKTLTELKSKVFPEWDAVLAKARAAARTAGLDENTVTPVPARGWWDKLNKDFTAGY